MCWHGNAKHHGASSGVAAVIVVGSESIHLKNCGCAGEILHESGKQRRVFGGEMVVEIPRSEIEQIIAIIA